FGLCWMAERPQRLAEKRLQVHLTRIDDVVYAFRASERRRDRVAVARRRRPQWPSIGLPHGKTITEVTPEQPELPELIREILADIRDDAVGPYDDLLA